MASMTYIVAPQDWKPTQLPKMCLFGPPWRKNQWHTSSASMSHQNSDKKSIKPCTWVALIQISPVGFMQPLPCFALSTNGNMTDFAHFHCIHLTNSFVVCNIVHCIVDHQSSSSSSFFLSFFLSFFCAVWKDGGFLQAENCIFQLFAYSCANFWIRSKSRMPLAPHPCSPSGTWGWISHTDGMRPSQFCQEETLLLAPPLPLHTQNLQINWWCQSFLSHFLPN